MSRIAWLWWRRANDAHEDFLTESLALATQIDDRPLVALLSSVLGVAIEPSEPVKVETQFPVGGIGFGDGKVDLRVVWCSADGTREAWVEVKRTAGVHGDQLETYQRARVLAPFDPERPPYLVVLGGGDKARKGAADHGIPWTGWSSLVEIVTKRPGSFDPVWGALADFLKTSGAL